MQHVLTYAVLALLLFAATPASKAEENSLPSWNEGPAKQAIPLPLQG
jgi:hypothetical protein